MAVRMQQRKGTAAEWLAANPVLAAGEIGFETDTGYFKVGNATSTWTQLEYFKSEPDLEVQEKIDLSISEFDTALALELNARDQNITDAVNSYTDSEIQESAQGLTTYVDNVVEQLDLDLKDYTDTAVSREAGLRHIEIESAIASEVTARDIAISDAVNLAIQTEISDRDEAIQLAIASEAIDRNQAIEAAISEEFLDRNAAIDAAIEDEVLDRNAAIDAAIAAQALLTEQLVSMEIQEERVLIDQAIESAIDSEEINRNVAIASAIQDSEELTQGLIDNAIATAATDATTKANQAEADANSYTDTKVSDHNSDTLNVHGISNTADLATMSYADDAVATHNSDTTNVHGIVDTAALATKVYADDAVIAHNLTTTNVHGIADTSALETQTGAQNKANAAYSNAVSYTNQEVSEALTSANAYTDQAELDANQYTDDQIVSALQTAQGYATTAQNNAEQYADDLAINYEPAGSVSTHESQASDVHGVPITSDIVGTNMTQTLTNKILGSGTILSANLDANAYTITNVAEPTEGNHVATKAYVDAVAEGLHIHESVVVSTTENINLSNGLEAGDSIDNVTLVAGMRVLVKNQTTQSENGIYIVQASGAAVRANDFNSASEIASGDFVYVANGSLYGGTSWVQTNSVTQLNTDPIIFVQFAGPNTLIGGNGIFVIGNEVSINDTVVATRSWVTGELETATPSASTLTGTNLNSNITTSNLQVLGDLESLQVDGEATFSGDITSSGNASFTGSINVPTPTASTHATTKGYVDNLIIQSFIEIRTLDDLSNYLNGYESRFKPTYQGVPVAIKHPFNLLLTIDGIIQSVGSPDYVWQSVLPRVGFDIDYEGYIKFPEPIPPGSSFDARILVGSDETKQTKVYPFKAADILLGGY